MVRWLAWVAAVGFVPVDAIWPIPRHLSTGNATLFLDQSLEVTYNGECVTYIPGYGPPDDITTEEIVLAGVSRALDAIFRDGLDPWMLRPRGPESAWEPHVGNSTRLRILEIIQHGDDDDANDDDGGDSDDSVLLRPRVGSVDESYTLDVTAAGVASITANSSTGVLHALETFTQLWFQHSCGSAWYAPHVPVCIRDEPRFPYRGMLLDVARHWIDSKAILRTIDALAMNKMNFFHLHITDTQSWPLEVPALPRLAEKGAYRRGLTYSPQLLRQIQEYGALRGVQVVLEVDMPGHVGVDDAYPDVSVAFKAQPWQWYCAQPPCGSFRLNNSKTEAFIETLLDDVLPRIKPWTAYFHLGGDEYKANNSLLDPALKTSDTKILQPLLQRFVDHAHEQVRRHGLVPIVWEEMVLDWNITMGEDVVAQTWLGKGAIQKLADKGLHVIDTSNEFYYLDCGRGDWIDVEGQSVQANYPFLDWCNPTKNWRLIYTHDPTDGLTEEAKKKVLGGELAVWTETIDPLSLDTIVWPRAAAAAEIWWSGRADDEGRNRSLLEARPRLGEQRERMLLRGIPGAALTQMWCGQQGLRDCMFGA